MLSYLQLQQLKQRVNIYNIKNSDLNHSSFRQILNDRYYTETKEHN